MDVSIIIVTYNSGDTITDCLASVRAQRGVTAEIIVVDNVSQDDTVQKVKEFGGAIHLIENRQNVGFGRGNNRGFAASTGRYIYLLNPDAQLTQTNALAGLCTAFEQNPGWGVAGTRVVSADGLDELKPSRIYPGQKRVRRDFSRLPGEIAWVAGTSMFFSRAAYAAVGGFDPDFFLYSEETDLCLRLRETGYTIGFVSAVLVKHIGGASERGNDLYQVWLRHQDSLHLFWQKHYSPEEIIRLAAVDKWRACFRMVSYRVLECFKPPGSLSRQKRRYYQALRRSSSRLIEKMRSAGNA